MNATGRPIHEPVPRGSRPGVRGLLLAGLATVCASAFPASAFGEGSADINTGPGGSVRQGMMMSPGGVAGAGHTTLYVYAKAGETVNLGSSAVGTGGTSGIRVYSPGTDLDVGNFPTAPMFGTQTFTCGPAVGAITSRAQELAGPAPAAGGYTPCVFTPTVDGIYPVLMMPSDTATNGGSGTVDAPLQTAPNFNIAMWDVTVRAGGVTQPGRTFSYGYALRTSDGSTAPLTASGVEVFPYTKTGYQYKVNLTNQGGINWLLQTDDMGVLDAATGERLFASATSGDPVVQGPRDRRYPQFITPADPEVISGPGGLSDTRGYSATPITPSSNPLANAAFTGSKGQAGATDRDAGGTISFTSPPAMEGLGYTVQIDTNRDGTFGNASDFVDDTKNLGSGGSNAFAWNGRDDADTPVTCGTYSYRVSATLAEVHFTMNDVENSGGTRIERLSLPTDPDLGDPYAASYNDVNPYSGALVTNTSPPAAQNADSRAAGFRAWSAYSGDVDMVDTWAQLPAVGTTGALQILCADLLVRKTSTPAKYQPGGELAFALTATNNGPDPAIDVTVTDTLPAGLTFVSADPGCTAVGQTVTCAIASLDSGANRTFNVTTKAATAATGCLRNAASVASDTFDPDAANNQTSICVPPAQADVKLTKTSSTSPVVPGEDVEYELTVSNDGPDTATGVVITDKLPSELEFVSASDGCVRAGETLTCTVASLANAASRSFTIKAKAPSSLKGCPLNTATVAALTADTDLTNNDASACPPLEGKSDLEITKTASASTVASGGQVMYTLVVKNNGPSDATGVMIEDPLAPGLTLVSAKPGQGTCTVAAGKLSCNVGALEVGAATQVLVTATAPADASCPVNTAKVRGDQQDPKSSNNNEAAKICSGGPPPAKFDLVVDKRGSAKHVRVGQRATYRIVVSNKGPDAAPDVRLTDAVNVAASVVSVRSTAGTCDRRLPMGCSLGTIKAGGKVTITIVLVHKSSGSRVYNVASATGSGTDVDPSNNLDRVSTRVTRVPLRLTKVASRSTVKAGERFSYTIRVSNPSRGVARDVEVCDTLPSGVAYVSASSKVKLTRGTHCWPKIKRLGAGESKTFRMTVRVLSGTSGRKTNVATAKSPSSRSARATSVVRISGGRLKGGGVTG